MKEILMVPGLILAVVLCPLLLAGACYVAVWKYYRQGERLNGN